MTAEPAALDDAQRRLVEASLGEADHAVRRMRLRWQPVLSAAEARSAAHEGLLGAALGFSPQSGVPFGAYARFRIEGAIFDALRFAGRPARLDAALLAASRRRMAEIEDPSDPLRDTPEDERRDLVTELHAHAAAAMLGWAREAQAQLSHEGHQEAALRAQRVDAVRRARAGLPEAQRALIELFFGLGDEPPLELKQIAPRIGVSYITARRWYRAALASLRDLLESEGVCAGIGEELSVG